MLADITGYVRSGIADNSQRGVTVLTLRLTDNSEPIRIPLCGNCLGELMGTKVHFENTEAEVVSPGSDLQCRPIIQVLRNHADELCIGDISMVSSTKKNDNGTTGARSRAQVISIEFFHACYTRILIEGKYLVVRQSEPHTWNPCGTDELNQRMRNVKKLREHIVLNAAFFSGPALSMLCKKQQPCLWDLLLNRAEAYTNLARSIRDKYDNTPRGKLYKAFALDLLDTTAKMIADDKETDTTEEKQEECRSTSDAVRAIAQYSDSNRVRMIARASQTHLFHTATYCMMIVQQSIKKQAPVVAGENASPHPASPVDDVSALLISILATILLIQEDEKETDAAGDRIKIILQHAKHLLGYAELLPSDKASIFVRTIGVLCSELRSFRKALL